VNGWVGGLSLSLLLAKSAYFTQANSATLWRRKGEGEIQNSGDRFVMSFSRAPNATNLSLGQLREDSSG